MVPPEARTQIQKPAASVPDCSGACRECKTTSGCVIVKFERTTSPEPVKLTIEAVGEYHAADH